MKPIALRWLSRMACGLALLWLPPLAMADVWGFVDEKGVAHFAPEQKDARYELFFKRAPNLKDGAADRAMPTKPAHKLLTFFEISSSYKSVRHWMREAARTHGIEFELLQALIASESGFDAAAVSPRGALGLMQIMPATAERYGVLGDAHTALEKKLLNPRTNIQTGSRYLRTLQNLFPGRIDLVLAAYNAGEGAVLRAGSQVPDYPETQNYVKTVMALYIALKPPLAVQQQRNLPIPGGAIGRGNDLPLLNLPPANATVTVQQPSASLGFIY